MVPHDEWELGVIGWPKDNNVEVPGKQRQLIVRSLDDSSIEPKRHYWFQLRHQPKNLCCRASTSYWTVLSAVRVIANNAPHSWLAADKDGVPINMEEDGILTASSYHFFVDAVTYDYLDISVAPVE
ncbi:hypothetical protein V8F06_013515 [Rhypophila decipiens]